MTHHRDDDLSAGRDALVRVFAPIGPFTTDRANEAASAVRELTRYLAHATYPGRAVQHVPDLYAVLGGLGSAAHSLAQVCHQLTDRLSALTTDPSVRVADGGRSRTAEELAARAADRTDAATAACNELAGCLDSAQAAVGRLYHSEPDDDTDPDVTGGG